MPPNNTFLVLATLCISVIGVRPTLTATLHWEPASGVPFVQPTCFAVSGTTILMGSDSGMCRSTDDGRTWTPANNGLRLFGVLPHVAAIVVRGTEILAAGSFGVVRSTNGGDLWTRLPGNAPSASSMVATDSAIFVGVANCGGCSGVFRSTDNGATWESASAGLPGNTNSVFALLAIGDTIFAADSVIYRSTDNGTSWTETSGGLLGGPVFAFTEFEGTMIAATYDSGVYRSTNRGESWSPSNTGLSYLSTQYQQVNSFCRNGASIFAASNYGGVFQSRNGGDAWELVTGLPASSARIVVARGTTVIAVVLDGVYRSTDGGARWAALDVSNLISRRVTTLAVGGSTLYGATDGQWIGLYESTNDGATWKPASPALTDVFVDALCVKDTTVFAGAYKNGVPARNGVYRTTDAGTSWKPCWDDSGRHSMIGSFAVCGDAILAGGDYSMQGSGAAPSLYRSTDDGTSWKAVAGDITIGQAVGPFAVIDTTILTMTFGTSSAVYRSTNSGRNWLAISTPGIPSSNFVTTFAARGPMFFAGLGSYGGQPGARGVYRSTDDGDSWQPANSGLPDDMVQTMFARDESIFVGTAFKGVYRSSDNGDSWIPENDGVPISISNFAAIGTTIFAATDIGVYRADLSAVSVRAAATRPSTAITVSPNPARDQLRVLCNVVRTTASITLYNVLGERVRSGQSNDAGELIMDVGALPAGMYILLLRNGMQSATRTVMIAR